MSKPLIITRLYGGLGNQMFQYAAGRALSLVRGCELRLDITAFEDYAIHNGYELGRYNIEAGIASSEDIRQLSGLQNRPARYLRRKYGLGRKTHFTEMGFGIMPEYYNLNPPVYLDGYWQSYKYFEAVADTISKELSPVSEAAGMNKKLAATIAETESVSIHIRRGDYIDNPVAESVHGFVGLAYYHAALKRVSKHLKSPHYFVFSDDITWARGNLGLSDSVTYVDHNSGSSSFEDMRLMSLCRNHVIANSSFSWWAAWLDSRSDKVVYYPEKWFVDNSKNTSSLCPTDWVSVS